MRRLVMFLAYQLKRIRRHELEERLKREGLYPDVVQSGPFAGLRYPPNEWAPCRFQKILGTYELELHPLLHRLAATKQYRTILNIGASEGFYSVGFARMFPQAKVISYEGHPDRLATTPLLAEANGVSDRLSIQGWCNIETLAAMKPQAPVLVWMDIDTGEKPLLDPVKVAWFRDVEIVVELHDCLEAGMTELIRSRFESTHTIEQFTNHGLDYAKYPLLRQLTFTEIGALLDEDRRGIQDWFYMIPKTESA